MNSDNVLSLEKQCAKNDFNAIACEMEGAAIAAVCRNYDIPFVVIRCMSDKADGNAHEIYDHFSDDAADQSGRIVIKMLENLSGPAEEKTEKSSQTETAYAGKLFDESYVHRIDITLSDGDWAGLLADPASKTKYQADVVIDGDMSVSRFHAVIARRRKGWTGQCFFTAQTGASPRSSMARKVKS